MMKVASGSTIGLELWFEESSSNFCLQKAIVKNGDTPKNNSSVEIRTHAVKRASEERYKADN